MISHVKIGVDNLEEAVQFYDEILEPLGHKRNILSEKWAGYGDFGSVGINTLWIIKPINGSPATAGNGSNFAFLAPTRTSVDEFYTRAINLGGQNEGKPGLRPEMHEHFYAAYVRDRDGNKLVAVCHEAV